MQNILQAYIFTKPLPIHTALAIEQEFFHNYINEKQSKTHINEYVVLFWRSEKSVIIGRNQNPWIECNLPFLEENNITLARRDSGGGTVYHDEGNLNISILSKNVHNRVSENLKILLKTLKISHNISCTITEKNDILMGSKKITGSAMRIVKECILHHFTLLLNANPISLRKSLTPQNSLKINTKSVASRPHSVANSHCATNIIINTYIDILEKTLSTKGTRTTYNNIPKFQFIQKNIHNSENRLKDDKWIFGRTPTFSINIPIEGTYYITTFVNGQLTKVTNHTQNIEPFTNIYMTKKSLEEAINSKTEKSLIKTISNILYHQYYTNNPNTL